jgi:hypothetical protein
VHSGDFTSERTFADHADIYDWLNAIPHADKPLIAKKRASLFQHFATLIWRRASKNTTYLEDSEKSIDGLKFQGSQWPPGYLWMASTLRAVKWSETRWSSVPPDKEGSYERVCARNL